MKSKVSRLFIYVSMIGLSMCSEDTQLQVEKSQELIYSPDRSIRYNGSYLEFSSPSQLENLVLRFRESGALDIVQWTQEIGFVSMGSIFDKAVEEQDSYISKLERRSLDEGTNFTKPAVLRNKFVEDNKDVLVIDDEGYVRGLKLFHPDYAYLVNRLGILKVAGHLLQYTENSLKIIIDGDEDKISLLGNLNSTDEDLGIVVNEVKIQNPTGSVSKKSSMSRYDYSHQVVEEFSHYPGRLRIIGNMQLQSYNTPIYGSSICTGSDCGGGGGSPQARTNATNCYCYNPIIGYNSRTLFQTHMEVQTRLLFWWKAYRVNGISRGTCVVNGATKSRTISHIDRSNFYNVIYDGPIGNVTFGSAGYEFRELGLSTVYRTSHSFQD